LIVIIKGCISTAFTSAHKQSSNTAIIAVAKIVFTTTPITIYELVSFSYHPGTICSFKGTVTSLLPKISKHFFGAFNISIKQLLALILFLFCLCFL
jgi:hypothetical protein